MVGDRKLPDPEWSVTVFPLGNSRAEDNMLS